MKTVSFFQVYFLKLLTAALGLLLALDTVWSGSVVPRNRGYYYQAQQRAIARQRALARQREIARQRALAQQRMLRLQRMQQRRMQQMMQRQRQRLMRQRMALQRRQRALRLQRRLQRQRQLQQRQAMQRRQHQLALKRLSQQRVLQRDQQRLKETIAQKRKYVVVAKAQMAMLQQQLLREHQQQLRRLKGEAGRHAPPERALEKDYREYQASLDRRKSKPAVGNPLIEQAKIRLRQQQAQEVGKKRRPARGESRTPVRRYDFTWQGGPALAKQTGKPIGRFGSRDDIDWVMSESKRIPAGKSRLVKLPAKHDAVVHLPDGRSVKASWALIKVIGDGRVYAFPTVAGPPVGDKGLKRSLVGVTKGGKIFNVRGVENLDLTTKGVDNFLSSNAARIRNKLGAKIGQGRLPFERGRAGFDKALSTVEQTLRNPSDVVGPFTGARGGNMLIDVFSKQTGFTVRIRGDGSFDTLIQGATPRVRP